MIYSNGTPEKAKEIYEIILNHANYFLHCANKYEIVSLQSHNPTFEELADTMNDLAVLIFRLVDHIDPSLVNKALDYTQSMKRMAIAISNKDVILLEKEVKNLEKKPFV